MSEERLAAPAAEGPLRRHMRTVFAAKVPQNGIRLMHVNFGVHVPRKMRPSRRVLHVALHFRWEEHQIASEGEAALTRSVGAIVQRVSSRVPLHVSRT